ncbi:MAG: hypothetical protein AAF355_14030 [Myxococcota bacterium]
MIERAHPAIQTRSMGGRRATGQSSLTAPILLLPIAILLSAPAEVRADAVLLLRPIGAPVADDGSATRSEIDDVEDAIADAVLAEGHRAQTEFGAAASADAQAAPSTANEMRAIAELQHVAWVVQPEVVRYDAAEYRLRIKVFMLRDLRIEEALVTIVRAREAADLGELMRHALSDEGIGDFDLDAARRARQAEFQQQQEEEARAQAAAEAQRERERKAQATEDKRLARQQRERYDGSTGRRMIQLGFGARGLLTHDSDGTGGTLYSTEGRFGYVIESVPGLELRAGLDAVGGSVGGMALHGGAAYLASPFTRTPIHFGGSLEIGWFQGFTGNKRAAFMLRTGGLLAFRLTDQLYLEASAPELTLFSRGTAIAVGASARLGYRF